MKFIIIEDELYAYKELSRMLKKLYPNSEVLAHFDSVKSAIKGLPDLEADIIFFDISLPDGFSFDILNSIEIKTPIIFTTAYDEYALKAFKYNSIDYLLKPIDTEDLQIAIEKFQSLKKQYTPSSILELSEMLHPKKQKDRFLVKIGDTYSYVKTTQIAYFYSEDKTTFIKTFDNHSYITDHSLNDIEKLLDHTTFFRVTRNMICSLNAIESSSKYFNSRLKLKLNPKFKEEILISRVKVKEFLEWLDK